MKNNNYKKIYCLTKIKKSEYFENFWGEEVACLTEEEINKLFKNYSVEEIKNIVEARRLAGSYTYQIVEPYLNEKSENENNTTVNLYSELNLPILTTHKLVKAGITTLYDLLLLSETEILNVKEINLEEYEMINEQLKRKKIYLKGAEDINRLHTIYGLLELINEERKAKQKQIEELEILREQLKKQTTYELDLIDELNKEENEIINNSEDKRIKLLRQVLRSKKIRK